MIKTFAKAIDEGDKSCLFWVLEKYGHHADFLGIQQLNTDSEKGWEKILSNVKQTVTESDTEEEHS
jgi:hypothetical protein